MPENNQNPMVHSGSIKRLVFAVYVKGSAGKTFFQAHLLEAVWKWGIRARGYDPDTSFHRLEGMCGADRVTRLDFEDPESLSVPVMDLALSTFSSTNGISSVWKAFSLPSRTGDFHLK